MGAFLNEQQVALEAARAGARVIRERYGLAKEVRVKEESRTLVTDTDIAAEAAILKVLKKYSGYSILSEESGLTGPEEGPRWIVDPLDGTSNFARSLPLFTVSVALVEGAEVYAGAIIDPVHQNEYFASKGGGAFCNNQSLCVKKPGKSVFSLFLNHGHQSRDKMRYAEVNARLAADYNIRKLGTTALELCYVAEGGADGFVCSGDEIWDFAAGVLIAAEAGCVFTDWQGNPWDGKSDFLLVARPGIHQNLIEKIRDIG